MNKGTLLKMVVCGVAFVTLSSIQQSPASAQEGVTCSVTTPEEGSPVAQCFFDPGLPQPVTQRADFVGNHSFKTIVFVTRKFWLKITPTYFSPPGPTGRYPDSSYTTCVPYAFNDGINLNSGRCTDYSVAAYTDNMGSPGTLIDPMDEHLYISFPIHYRVAWNHPTLTEFSGMFDNPRGLRALTSTSAFFDRTDAVFPNLVSRQDPGDDMSADGTSHYTIAQQTHGNGLVGCLEPLDCSRPTDPTANVFEAGRTIPVKVLLSPSNPLADLRLSFTNTAAGSTPQLAQASGGSNEDNMFRHTADHFTFDWSTSGLAPGVYAITISPGFGSGSLFAPETILVTLR